MEMLLEIVVDKNVDLGLGVLCQFGTSVPVEDAHGVGIQVLELVADDAVLARGVGLVLQLLDPVIDVILC